MTYPAGQSAGRSSPGRMAAGYALGACAVLLLIVLWLRGMLRPLLPLLLIIGVVLLVRRVVKAIAAPPPP